jgi:hypothetical protein
LPAWASTRLLIPWEARAVEIDAKRMSADARHQAAAGPVGERQIHEAAWIRKRSRMELMHFSTFATVPADRELIRQDEYGNFMIVLLSGSMAVDRVQPWGERLRLAETRPGEILGEMSLLDSGIRFSACITMNECEVAALAPRHGRHDVGQPATGREPDCAAGPQAVAASARGQRTPERKEVNPPGSTSDTWNATRQPSSSMTCCG